MIEVLFATLMLGVVGAAILTFLSAVSSGSAARQNASDSALESTLAVRRFATLAPDFRYTLSTTTDQSVVWLSDSIPSLTVHTSEAGLLRYDAQAREVVLEVVNPLALAANRRLERVYLQGNYDLLVADFAKLRGDGALIRNILAERVDDARLTPDATLAGSLRLKIEFDGIASSVTISPRTAQEPSR